MAHDAIAPLRGVAWQDVTVVLRGLLFAPPFISGTNVGV